MLFYECKCYEITTVKITYAELVLVALESNDFTYNQSWCKFLFFWFKTAFILGIAILCTQRLFPSQAHVDFVAKS